jgi:hypothetical protein
MRALLRFGFRQFVAQTVSQSCNNFILQLKEIGDALLEPVGPKVRSSLAINQLRVDADPVLVALTDPSRT